MKKIETIEQLKKEALETNLECFIQLGIARSSKTVSWDDITGWWWIHNEIDDTKQELKDDKELAEQTHIVEAIHKGALWAH